MNNFRLDTKSKIVRIFKILSILASAIGGILLASNIESSPYGFIFLAVSSCSFTIASILKKDFLNVFYGTTLFFGVDLLGVYRWIIIV